MPAVRHRTHILREALKAMELVGMLDSRVGDGTFVCPRSDYFSRPLLWAFTGAQHEELVEIMEARMLVEESLAGLAAERGHRRRDRSDQGDRFADE